LRLYQKIIWFINILIVFSTIFSYLSPYIHPAKTCFFAVFGLAFPWLFFANIAFILFWALNKPIYALLSIICLGAGFNYIDKFFGTHGIQDDQPYEHKINISTFNMQFSKSVMHIKDKEQRRKKMEEYKTYLKRFHEVDIFCGQEFGHSSGQMITAALGFKYVHKLKEKSTAIYSKHPIIAKGQIDFGTKVNSCVWADINVNDHVVRVYSAHLQSNRISGKESELIEAGRWERKTFLGLKDMFGKYQKYTNTRAEQAQKIKEHAATSKVPYIICGDFNDPPQSYVYQKMARNMNDSFRCAGSGIGTSFNGVIPALRIDYILASQDFDVYQHRVIKEGRYSDHYPIISTVALP